MSKEVHVWRARVDGGPRAVDALRWVLSDDERARAVRFRADAHRERFMLCRAAQREILSGYTGESPELLTFRYTEYGKPSLASAAGKAVRVRFNTSNSGDMAVIAVTADREIGVDVEHEREVPDALSLARRFFSPAELAALLDVPADQRHRAFLACWTRKEAFIKAVGIGVSMPLADFDVTVSPDSPAALLATRPDRAVAARWTMRSVDAGPGYLCALAAEGDVHDVRLFDWRDG